MVSILIALAVYHPFEILSKLPAGRGAILGTAETAVAVGDWWQAASPTRRREFVKALRADQIEVTALPLNNTLGEFTAAPLPPCSSRQDSARPRTRHGSKVTA